VPEFTVTSDQPCTPHFKTKFGIASGGHNNTNWHGMTTSDMEVSTSARDYAYPPSHPLFTPTLVFHFTSASSSPKQSQPPYEKQDDFAEPMSEYSSDIINARAIAIYDFEPEHENEIRLRQGGETWISHRYGDGWLVAEDPTTGMFVFVPLCPTYTPAAIIVAGAQRGQNELQPNTNQQAGFLACWMLVCIHTAYWTWLISR